MANFRDNLPGAYTNVTADVLNIPNNLDSGGVIVIDTGIGTTWGTTGIDSELLDSPADSILRFNSASEMKAAVRGGPFFLLADDLFNPAIGIQGASYVIFANTTTTVKSLKQKTITETGSSFTITAKEEGVFSNGVLEGTNLYKGYGFKIIEDSNDSTKFAIQIDVGTWRGEHDDVNLNGVTKADAVSVNLIEIGGFTTLDELKTKLEMSDDFNNLFTISIVIGSGGTGTIVEADEDTTYVLLAGGTQTYASANLLTVLDYLKNSTANYILLTKSGTTDMDDQLNKDVVNYNFTHKKIIFIGGGNKKTDFTSHITKTKAFNSQYVVTVYGSERAIRYVPAGERLYNSLFLSAKILGRSSGVEPQNPLTFKSLGFQKLVHELTEWEQEQLLDAGSCYVYYNFALGRYAIGEATNTLQRRQYLINTDGTSSNLQVIAVVNQLRKEIVLASVRDLLATEQGANRNTLSVEIVTSWLTAFLQSKVATPDIDNYLLSFESVVVTFDANKRGYYLNFRIQLNSEINRLLYTMQIFI